MPRSTPDPLTPEQVRARPDPLTDTRVRALQPGRMPIDVRDGGQRGLLVTVLPSGKKQWTIRYRTQGKQRRLVLGNYPAVTVAKARKLARKALSDIDSGSDLAAERRAAKAVRTDTVDALVTDYLDEHVRPHTRDATAKEYERILHADVLPAWGDRSARDITRLDVKALLRRILTRGSPVAANRTLAVVRKMFNYAIDDEQIDGNPAARVKKPADEKSRDRVLSDDELRRLWRLLSNPPTTADKPAPGRKRVTGPKDDPLCPISAPLAALLKVQLLAAPRIGEVIKMRWRDLDLDKHWWTIPESDAKNGRPHRVYLADEALALITAQAPTPDDEPREFVFVGSGASLRDRAKKASAVIAEALGFDFRSHDLRRTAATRMAESGIPRAHIAHVLNHTQAGSRSTQVYDRYAYDKEKQIALEAWARVLRAILAEQPTTGTVVPFASASA